MNDSSDIKPTVSICATFFNAEKYIRRLLESCLCQTYENIELVIVDDQSVDNSATIIEEYAKRDPRIKYFKNEKRIGLAESELKMFESATGQFSIMLGADDWLARDFIENGVKCFLTRPNIAGVIPRLISLQEEQNGSFTLADDTFYEFSAPKIRESDWFIKNIYKPKHLYISALALVRAGDYARAMKFYVENYYRNLPASAPEKTKHLMKMAFGMDSIVFAEILTRYKNFAFDSSLRYLKIALPDGQTNNLNFNRSSLPSIIEESLRHLNVLEIIYQKRWPKFHKPMKVFKGAEMLCTAAVSLFENKLRHSFIKIPDTQSAIKKFFKNYSFLDLVKVSAFVMPFIITRAFKFIIRKIIKRFNYDRVKKPPVFIQDNFLNQDKCFKISSL